MASQKLQDVKVLWQKDIDELLEDGATFNIAIYDDDSSILIKRFYNYLEAKSKKQNSWQILGRLVYSAGISANSIASEFERCVIKDAEWLWPQFRSASFNNV